MKIGLIGDTLFHQGAEYVLAVLARGFVANGHEVDVILSHRQHELQIQHPDWKPYELPEGCNVTIGTYSHGRHSVLALRRLMAQRKYDVVMCHASPYSIPLALSCMILRRRPKIIHVEHSPYVGVTRDGKLCESPRKVSLKSRVLNLVMSQFDAQFTVSKGTADAINRMTGYPRNKIHVVYNPVVDDVFFSKLKQQPAHPWLNDGGDPVLVAAGAFQPYKNHQMLIRAFERIQTTNPSRLIIFGDGPLRTEYDTLIAELKLEDRISLPGFTDNLPAAIRKAAAYVISSTVESFSIVCIEALASGTPVVSTNCPYGPPELLADGKNGIVVKNNDVGSMADGLVVVLNRRGVKPTDEMIEPYKVSAIIKRYEEALRGVMACCS